MKSVLTLSVHVDRVLQKKKELISGAGVESMGEKILLTFFYGLHIRFWV